jgi:hypothetical protein
MKQRQEGTASLSSLINQYWTYIKNKWRNYHIDIIRVFDIGLATIVYTHKHSGLKLESNYFSYLSAANNREIVW